MLRFIKRLILLCFLLALLTAAGAGMLLYWLVAVNPGPEIELSYIESILGRESPVFYRDGEEKIGVLFQDAHRQYLPYYLIPKEFVNAIVAAEDDQFFHHYGIDFLGITRAMIANIRAGRIIQGGSTITQQTAKNLFKRESRTYRAKFKELLFALRLEYHYPKEKILEFYVNQFFVSGNGHGLGVAARYYFDKDVSELTLLENAFIAGSVKRPNYYNPFTKSSEEAAARARKRAEERAGYVLNKMNRLGYINERAYRQALNSDIVFRRGRMSFSLNTVMDLVREGLASPEITRVLEEHGISNVSTSGIRITTTIDRELQDASLHALRRELSRLDVRLRGYDREEVQREYSRLEYKGDPLVRPGAFLFGRISEMTRDDDGEPTLRISLGKNRPEGFIDRQGLERILTALVRFKRQRWSTAGTKDMPSLLDQLRVGDRVYVSVRDVGLSGTPSLSLERFPEIQGAALVMQQGAIRSMAGGMENRYFNRAVAARRLMGSTFKPFLFAAALQLGWSSTDRLDNRRNVFVFQDKPYFPRPDHISPHDEVSLSWAGVNSENLAAIWLLYNLTDRLTPPRLGELAEFLDLTPREKEGQPESYEHFKRRIRDKFGIVINRDILLEAVYDRAVRRLEADFLFDDRAAEYLQLRQLPYGLHYDRYAQEIRTMLDVENKSGEKMSDQETRELRLRLDILGRTYLGLQESMELLRQHKVLYAPQKTLSGIFDALAFFDRESGAPQPEGMFYDDGSGHLIFSVREPEDDWSPVPEDVMRTRTGQLDERRLEEFWGQVRLEGYLSVYAYRQVASQMEQEKEELFSARPYSMEVLSSVRDYRLLVGLQYLVRFGREMGIASEMEPVLSFPLGSNVITLIDAVRLYESLVTGKNYSSGFGREFMDEKVSLNGLAVIERIDTVDGETIYARQVVPRNVLAPRVSSAVGNILQNTVQYGTGRYAHQNVRLTSSDPEREKTLRELNLPLPLLGKTGTANQFRNAAFLGYVPAVADTEAVARLTDGYTVGVYVGFDDNRKMVRKSTHITGATGALPAWAEIAQRAFNLENPGDRLDLADLSFNGLPLKYPEVGQVFVAVDPEKGGHIVPGSPVRQSTVSPSSPSVLTFGRAGGGNRFEPERHFLPFWKTGP
jgi:membrane peptidoglycan carboxypeptidase